MVNIVLLLLPLIIGYSLSLFANNREGKSRCMIVPWALFMFIYWSFFDFGSVPDVEYTNITFDYLGNHSITQYLDTDSYSFDPGFLIYLKSLHILSDNPRVIYVVRSIVVLFCFIHAFKNHSKDIPFSILVFLLYAGSVFQSIFVVRQYMAAAIFLLSINYIINKRFWKYLIVSIIAISFHASLIVCFPLYFAYNYIKITKKSLFLIVVAVAIIAMTANMLLVDFSAYFSLYTAYTDSDYFEADAVMGGVGYAVRSVFFLFVFLVVCRKSINENYGKLYFWVLCLTLILSFGIIGIRTGSRLMPTVNYWSFLIIPYIYINIQKKLSKRFFYIGMLLLFVLMTYREMIAIGDQTFKFMEL